MTKTWPSKTLRVVILSYEIHVVELQAYVRVQGYGHSVKFFSFGCSRHMIDRFRNLLYPINLLRKIDGVMLYLKTLLLGIRPISLQLGPTGSGGWIPGGSLKLKPQ